ncbi:hypothetical protein H0N98_04490 [Candidatus Micrarchaeota archaeon]|nr:hypothetical protein [Candidatus Micrarchaeota archaeon]
MRYKEEGEVVVVVVEWKKILKVSFIPVAIWFLIEIIASLIWWKYLNPYPMLTPPFYDLWVLGSIVLIFIIIGYSAIKSYNLRVRDATIAGIFAVFFFVIAELAPTTIDCDGFGLNVCKNNILYYHVPSPPLMIFGLIPVLIGAVIARIREGVKPREKPKTKKPKRA